MSAADFAQQQDLHALYSSHHGWLQGWLRHKLGNAGEAADLAQDTFVSVLTNGTAPQIREARPFLATIARRLVVLAQPLAHQRQRQLPRQEFVISKSAAGRGLRVDIGRVARLVQHVETVGDRRETLLLGERKVDPFR